MAEIIIMPKVGISVESCLIGTWQKNVGDMIEVGDVLFDYETDKATIEYEATINGTLLAILYGNGEEVEVLKPICVIGEPGEDISGLDLGQKNQEKAETKSKELTKKNQPLKIQPQPKESTGQSPRAKALARRLNIDIGKAVGSGPQGRVIARDVQALVGLPISNATTDAIGSADYSDEKMTRIRQTIAKAMYASLQNTAQLTHHHSFDATAILALRADIKSNRYDLPADTTLGDLILYGTIATLMEHRRLNALMVEDEVIRTYSTVHLGVAVDTPRGLMVPTVFSADKLSLAQLSAKVKELATDCRNGNINPDLLTGATFTISNLGNLDVEWFTPILNPPQVGILGVGKITERPKTAEDGSIVMYPALGLSLTYDHRAVDGADASRFARDLCRKLEAFTWR